MKAESIFVLASTFELLVALLLLIYLPLGRSILPDPEDHPGVTFKVSSTHTTQCNQHEKFSAQPASIMAALQDPYAARKGRANKEFQFLQGNDGIQESHVIGVNSFVQATVRAYSNHHNLVIRPDDIWIAIMVQFSAYVNHNAEVMRSTFVNFEGKQKLTVEANGSLSSLSFAEITLLIEQEIVQHIDPELRKWLVPNFSTTKPSDRVVGAVVLMATLQHYFDYGVSITCGIPRITLRGTVSDWEEVRRRAVELVKYEVREFNTMHVWTGMLLPVLDKLVKTAKKNIDITWWQTMVTYTPKASGTPYISGWITVFCAFDADGNFMPPMLNGRVPIPLIPRGFSSVPVSVNDNGAIYNTTMLAGHITVDLEDEGHTIIPRLDWCIFSEKKR